MKFFIERFRMDRAVRSGIVWWNLLDGWPQLSDAVVDYYFVKKLAYRVIRRVQQPLVLSLAEPEAGRSAVVACSERREGAEVEWAITDVASGERVAAGKNRAPGESATQLGHVTMPGGVQRLLRIDWSADGTSGTNHYLAGEPPFDFATVAAGLRTLGLA